MSANNPAQESLRSSHSATISRWFDRVLGYDFFISYAHADLPGYAEQQLQQAYVFLRRVENRLQMADDQQTHALPGNELAESQKCDQK